MLKNLNEIVENYRQEIDELISFQSDSRSALVSFEFDIDKMLSYLKSIQDEEEREVGLAIFSKKKEYFPRYEKTVSKLLIAHAVSILEAFLVDLVKVLLRRDQRSLRSGKKLTYEEILEIPTQADLIEYILEKEILEFSHYPFKDKIGYLRDKFGIGELDNKIDYLSIQEIFASRNIILHNNGIVNKAYQNANPSSDFVLGEPRRIDLEYNVHVCAEIMNVVQVICDVVISKYKEP